MLELTSKHTSGLSPRTSTSPSFEFGATEDYLHNLVPSTGPSTMIGHTNGLAWLSGPIHCHTQTCSLLLWDGPGQAAKTIDSFFLISPRSERKSWLIATALSHSGGQTQLQGRDSLQLYNDYDYDRWYLMVCRDFRLPEISEIIEIILSLGMFLHHACPSKT